MSLDILIVDDSSLTRKAIKRIIGMIGMETSHVFEAENGADALEILNKMNVDIVLADLNMPKMGGVEMIHLMRTNDATRSIPVVIISTESSTIRIEKLLADGVKDYLHKPFTPEELRELITRAVGVKQ